MTDPRIEAAARELKRLFSEGETSPDSMWLSCAKCVLDAADVAAWFPIESAPRDGTSILTWGSPGSHSVCETRYLSVGPYIHRVDGARFQKEPVWYWSGWDGAVGPIPEPTRWQPLPQPPTQI